MDEIVITGADGFLGSHCVDAALARGLRVHAVCQYRPDGSIGLMEPYRERVTFYRVDLSDFRWICDPYGKYTLEELPVINCAAMVSVPHSYYMPGEYWRVNADCVVHLAQLCPKLVHVSTSEVFDGRSGPYRVDSVRNPVTPYGASKAAGEMAVLGYSRTGRVVRCFNLYGPRQYPRAVHPLFIRAAIRIQRGLPAKLKGPHGSRAFLYAPWVAEKLVSVAIDGHHERLIQLASDTVFPIGTLWQVIAGHVGVDPAAVEWDATAGHDDVPDLWGHSSGGFQTPGYDYDGLDETIAYYAAQPGFCEMGDYQ